MLEVYYRLVHNKDGSYKLQEGRDVSYLDRNIIRNKRVWEDVQTVEEEDSDDNTEATQQPL